jgi:hypothetical protein
VEIVLQRKNIKSKVVRGMLDVRVVAQGRHPDRLSQCPLLAQSGHHDAPNQCPLLGVKRTLRQLVAMSAFDPKRTSTSDRLTASSFPV